MAATNAFYWILYSYDGLPGQSYIFICILSI